MFGRNKRSAAAGWPVCVSVSGESLVIRAELCDVILSSCIKSVVNRLGLRLSQWPEICLWSDHPAVGSHQPRAVFDIDEANDFRGRMHVTQRHFQ
jgi:hypothetical protein